MSREVNTKNRRQRFYLRIYEIAAIIFMQHYLIL